MNFFEDELKKIMGESAILKDQKYVGRSCYGTVSDELRARIEFVTLGTYGHYEGIKASIINRKEGVVDSMLLRFADIWGRRKVGNPNFQDGIVPYIWNDNGKSDWYVFKPGKEDYRQAAGGIENYLSVFQDMAMAQAEHSGGMQQMT